MQIFYIVVLWVRVVVKYLSVERLGVEPATKVS